MESTRSGMALFLFLVGAIVVLVIVYALMGYITAMAPMIIMGAVLGVALFLVVLGMIFAMSSSRAHVRKK